MRLDLDLMHKIHEQSLQGLVARKIGDHAEPLARRLAERLVFVHGALDVDLLPDGLVVFTCPDDARVPGFSADLSDLTSVDPYPHRGFTVQVLEAGFRVRPGWTEVASLPGQAVAYTFAHPREEAWYAEGESAEVINPQVGVTSAFATRVFASFDEALDHYASALVRECRCLVLAEGWLDDRRIFWRQRPEIQIRRSVEQYLASALRAVVEVEHIVDEDKEVDVYVYWNTPMRGAFVECKWLGTSASEPGLDGRRKITRFGPKDARDGLAQLADYLDRQRPRASGRSFKGYLLVVDGRRWGANNPDADAAYSNENLLRYEHQTIDWPPALLARSDLGTPRLMFCRPRL